MPGNDPPDCTETSEPPFLARYLGTLAAKPGGGDGSGGDARRSAGGGNSSRRNKKRKPYGRFTHVAGTFKQPPTQPTTGWGGGGGGAVYAEPELPWDEQDVGWMNDQVLSLAASDVPRLNDTVSSDDDDDDDFDVSDDFSGSDDSTDGDETDGDGSSLDANYPDEIFADYDDDDDDDSEVEGSIGRRLSRIDIPDGGTDGDNHGDIMAVLNRELAKNRRIAATTYTSGKAKSRAEEMPRLPFVDYAQLHLKLCGFLEDPSVSQLALPPLPNFLRRRIHAFCSDYRLKSVSHGSGTRRYIMLEKTRGSCFPALGTPERVRLSEKMDQSFAWCEQVEAELLRASDSADMIPLASGRQKQRYKQKQKQSSVSSSYGNAVRIGFIYWPSAKMANVWLSTKPSDKAGKKGRDGKGDKKKHANSRERRKAARENRRNGAGNSARSGLRDAGGRSNAMAAGSVVGHGAAPIGESNVGHKLLMRMGWRPGDAIGDTSRDSAIKVPIEAVIPRAGRGLGYN